MENKLKNFECDCCDFKCFKKGDWSRHVATDKHLNRTKNIKIEQKNIKNDQKFICKFCQKSYKARNSLWYHENKCEFNSEKSSNKSETDENVIITTCQQQQQTDIQALTGLIFEMVKSNTELQKSMFEICKQGQNNYTSNVSNNNCNNKTFNLQFFLNETCKDAMNISDFVESVKLQVSDLENVGKVGYIEGISNIIIKNLNALEV